VRNLDYELIDFLQPFIDGKVSHQCDLVRQERLNWAADTFSKTPDRHRGHTWCRQGFCECPCHWLEDAIAVKLLDVAHEYRDVPIVATWLNAYAKRQATEAARLRSLVDNCDAIVRRIQELS
jgi:hypothetical protein